LASFVKKQLHYDNENGIPKYIYAPLNDKTALCEITTSPLFEDSEHFLTKIIKRGYNAKINHSKIPIRF